MYIYIYGIHKTLISHHGCSYYLVITWYIYFKRRTMEKKRVLNTPWTVAYSEFCQATQM